MPYEVWAYEANDKAMMTSLMEKLHNDPEIDVVLMDSPGSLKAEGLIPMFVNSDIIIVPFHYDLITVPSTASFLMFVDRLKKAVGERMKARLFIIPNLNDGRIGKRSELLIWDNARDTFSNYGYVTAKIPKRADMEQFSTMAALDMQAAIVTPVFDKVYQSIFDTLQPIRGKKLKGIQLTENLNPKPKRKKKFFLTLALRIFLGLAITGNSKCFWYTIVCLYSYYTILRYKNILTIRNLTI